MMDPNSHIFRFLNVLLYSYLVVYLLIEIFIIFVDLAIGLGYNIHSMYSFSLLYHDFVRVEGWL